MWSLASHAIAGNFRPRSNLLKPSQVNPDCSDDDDEASSLAIREEGLECPSCLESFNIVENVPYVLLCGHTICKNCVLGLKWSALKFPALPVQLPLFVSCPWCHCLSFRLVYRGQVKFPRKNFFLLWIIESMNNGRAKWCSAHILERQSVPNSSGRHQDGRRGIAESMHSDNSHSDATQTSLVVNYSPAGSIQSSLQKSLAFLVHLVAKFPLVAVCLFVVLYAIPASAAILALYILITILFALPSFLILYFAYPGLDWLVREITS